MPGPGLKVPSDRKVTWSPRKLTPSSGGRAFGRILQHVAASGEIDWLVVHISLQNLFSYLRDPTQALENSVQGTLEAAQIHGNHVRWGLVLRTNGDLRLEEVRAKYRAMAVAQRMPVFTRLEDAAASIADVVAFEQHRVRMGAQDT